jgi:hypothetical protein
MNNHESDSLDREIERALSVDPSPEFVMRVRRHVAAVPAPAPRLVPRFFMVALASAAVVVIAVVAFTLRPVEKKNSVVARATGESAPPIVAPVPVPVPNPPRVSSPPVARLSRRAPERRVETPVESVEGQQTPLPGAVAGIEIKLAEVPFLEVPEAPPIILTPLPEMSLNPMAKLEGITIEPLTLVRDNGVQQ